MLDKSDWETFKSTGLLWFINSILHLFGWCIVFDYDDETDELIEVYPARTKFRGFSEELNSQGYIDVTEYLSKNVERLVSEAKE